MSPYGTNRKPVVLDAFSFATGVALIAGGLSLVAPFLNALIVALAAIAMAAWVMERRGAVGSPFSGVGRIDGIALGVLAAGVGVFVLHPPPLEPARGLGLALCLLPLWFSRRRSVGNPHPLRGPR